MALLNKIALKETPAIVNGIDKSMITNKLCSAYNKYSSAPKVNQRSIDYIPMKEKRVWKATPNKATSAKRFRFAMQIKRVD
jgi:hypothetical protein